MGGPVSIQFKSIEELITAKPKYDFHIPAYQRGYRWEKNEAKLLLEDIMKFSVDKSDDKSKNPSRANEIYCIQPLVVKQIDEEGKKYYNVIDGQQRLTTIFIIIKALQNKFNNKDIIKSVLGNDYEIYSLKYDTRKDSETFLANLGKDTQDKEENKRFIDYYYMNNVYTAVKGWFDEKTKKVNDTFLKTLLSDVKFIWYDAEEEIEEDVFQRLNAGKIYLTQSEKIKALFLNNANFKNGITVKERDEFRKKLVSEWNDIEYALQKDEFWYFLQNDVNKKGSTRIDLIFDILCRIDSNKGTNQNDNITDDNITYSYFENKFKDNKLRFEEIEALWKEIRRTYMVFEEWYNDFTIYHYIGYLVAANENKNEEILQNYLKIWTTGIFPLEYDQYIKSTNNAAASLSGKEKFKDYLKFEIINFLKKTIWINDIIDKKANQASDTAELLAEVQFGADDSDDDNSNNNTPKVRHYNKRTCTPLLLLHNIDTIIQQDIALVKHEEYALPNFTRFPFHLYNKTKWDIEHIRPDNGNRIKSENDKRIYLGLMLQFLDPKEDLYKEIIFSLSATEEKAEEIKKKLENTVSIEDTDNGTVTAEPAAAAEGAPVTIIDLSLINDPELKSEFDLYDDIYKKDCKKYYKEIINIYLDYLIIKLDIYEQSANSDDYKPVPESEKDRLGNYTLLDFHTNRQYQNMFFPLKREFIRLKKMGKKPINGTLKWDNEKKEVTYDLEDDVAFVPVCTENVFTKSYTVTPKSMMNWTQGDAKQYLKSIAETFDRYIK